MKSKIKAIIYDLDNTIYPAKTYCKPIFDRIIHTILSHPDNRYSQLKLEKIKSDLFQTAFVDVAKRYSFPSNLILSGKQILESAEFEEDLIPYEDCHVIKKLPIKSFLVTSGNIVFQEKKIKSLNITHLFDEIYIDDENAKPRIGKEIIFKTILKNIECNAEQVVVVGDNISSEILAGNSLGMYTIQILREGIQKGIEARAYIHSFTELPAIIMGIRLLSPIMG
jgi:putative hydrolase of the HAD superfamily